jgi:glutamyl-Q tRNA(Asp) synthetase
VPAGKATFRDELQATNPQASAEGDYVVFRRDGLVSYQLAVVVDDRLTGVNRVVRGADLMPTTARQEQLHELLGSPPPTWLHLPVLLNQRSTKLSKQAHALPVDQTKASVNLDMALQLLGQNPPADASRMPPAELITLACDQWRPEKLPAEQTFSTFIGW